MWTSTEVELHDLGQSRFGIGVRAGVSWSGLGLSFQTGIGNRFSGPLRLRVEFLDGRISESILVSGMGVGVKFRGQGWVLGLMLSFEVKVRVGFWDECPDPVLRWESGLGLGMRVRLDFETAGCGWILRLGSGSLVGFWDRSRGRLCDLVKFQGQGWGWGWVSELWLGSRSGFVTRRVSESWSGVGTKDPDTVSRTLTGAIRAVQKKARDCFADPIDRISADEFVKVLVVDGCFLIELFHKNADEKLQKDDDPIFTVSCMPELLGNKHILDLLRNSLVLPTSIKEKKSMDREQTMPSAARLKEAGIRFNKGIESPISILDIEFERTNGVLKFPPLAIHEETESLF
ncbi:hypothetical protein TIFTF001_026298 [Ficus carica]|uniref:Uncharacterized protein n=1 Tax=Ficus carica TaxID=3494 RepID=A0AA88IY18_FICCA|nr:hypothetical protein TIFTF001_026298 [Ficus carica]